MFPHGLGDKRVARARSLSAGLLLACALLAVTAPTPAEARSGCAGKRATIVSNSTRIVGTKAHDVIVAGPGPNRILGRGGNDTICGGGGDDVIHAGKGNDTVIGGPGDDAIHGERGSDDLGGGPGADRIFGETGNDDLDGGPGSADRVDGGPGDDRVDGGGGDADTVIGGVGNDRVDGGPGAHDIASYKGAGGPVTIDLRRGRVSGAEGERLRRVEDAVGGSAGDTLIGSPATQNRLDGGPGGDRLIASGPGDSAFGGPGGDSCEGAFAAETSCGPSAGGRGAAVELYLSITGAASLIVTGSDGPDDLVVEASADGYVVNGAGSAVEVRLDEPSSAACARDLAANSVRCTGQAGEVLAALGPGDDRLAIAANVPSGLAATIDGGPGADALSGGGGDDTLYGGDDRDPDSLDGGAGDDVLYGVNIFHPRRDSGAAQMTGGPGDDLMIGGQPCDGDLFDGGPGDNDSASFARVRNAGVNVRATIGGAVEDPDVGGCNAGRIAAGVEKIEGSPGPDILIGDDGPNTLLGRGGNDVIDGRGGFDRCIEGGGSDRVDNCETHSWRTSLRRRIR